MEGISFSDKTICEIGGALYKVYVVSVLQLPDEVSLVSRYMQMMLLE